MGRHSNGYVVSSCCVLGPPAPGTSFRPVASGFPVWGADPPQRAPAAWLVKMQRGCSHCHSEPLPCAECLLVAYRA